ncbi:uncharacterized protein LOC129612336 [Condylostylus longicornis]|uniref:uncharacterized protein LOC129612336 n=1 Tax=Condylostylus longicornis TaxID=2530218 RepID=UPI00244DCCAC|nr:uncharacterized protein LOC129612336 [Condylostylus longicornis]
MKRSRKIYYRLTTNYYRKVKKKIEIYDSATNNIEYLKNRNTIFEKENPTSSSLENDINSNTCVNSEINKNILYKNSADDNVFLINNYSSEESDKEIQNSFDDSNLCLSEDLRKWAIENNIAHSSINKLLVILNRHKERLPFDSRTLLCTPNIINVVPMGEGCYWYYGIINNLKNLCKNKRIPDFISLIFNVDGLPPFRSSNIEFWPILFKISEIEDIDPMVAAVYCGKKKPPLEPYFKCLIDELKILLKDGFKNNNTTTQIKIKFFVCDTPARSFIKGTVNFNSAFGCIKCSTVGKYDRNGRHMSFPRINCALRTDSNFRLMTDIDHHKEISPLTNLPIDMVEDIIVADSLHLFDLGIMRKCLYGWVNGNYNFRTKFSGKDIEEISNLLEKFNFYKPKEICRAIRRLNCLKMWKGTEFRTFLLYIGPVILKQFLSPEVYQHFLIFVCAVRIVSSKEHIKFKKVAQKLFADYIETFIHIYGEDSISMNVHNLCHVVADVNKFGTIPSLSSYDFENFLGRIKNLLRSGNKPLEQIAKRLIEISRINGKEKIHQDNYEIVPEKEIKNTQHPLLQCCKVFNRINYKNKFILSNEFKDKWFLTKSNKIICMINATFVNNEIHIYGCPIKNLHDFFLLPIKSSYLDIFISMGQQEAPQLFNAENDVKSKLFCLEYQNQFIYLPLLHSYK